MIFKREFLNLLYDSDLWLWDFKMFFSSLRLIVGVGSISRVLVVHQKTINVSFKMPFLCDNVFVRFHLFWVPHL